jgi:hypothetical protein
MVRGAGILWVKLEPLPLEVLSLIDLAGVKVLFRRFFGQRIAEDGQPTVTAPEVEECSTR